MLKALFLLVGLLLQWAIAYGQAPLLRSHPNKEFPDVKPTTLFQSREGWIWLGGEGGLLRFDGQHFEQFPLPDSNDLQVTAIYESSDRLWVGFQSGKIAYLESRLSNWPVANLSLEPQPFHYWSLEAAQLTSAISGFLLDSSGNLWISTYGDGLYCWSEGSMYRFNEQDETISSNDIYQMVLGADNRIWVATDAGISICSLTAAGQKRVQRLGTADGLPDEIVTCLLPDPSGNMWIGTYDHGVCRYNIGKAVFDFGTPDWSLGHVSAMATFGNQEIWVGTNKNGLHCIDIPAGTIRVQSPDAPIGKLKINALLKDREGQIWLLADRNNLYSLNIAFGLLETPDKDVQSILVDKHENIWVGTAKGLYLQQSGGFKNLLPRENILSIAELSDGTMLAGSFGNGLWIMSPKGGKIRHMTENEGIPNGSILSITTDVDGFWLATLGGAARCSWQAPFAPQDCICETLQDLGANYVYKVFKDKKGRVWFGTDGKGLFMLFNGSLRQFKEINGKTIRTVYDIEEDYKGQIWFTTAANGLYRWDGSSFFNYTISQQLHSNAIQSLNLDNKGKLLLGYEDGLDIFNTVIGHVAFQNNSTGLPAQSFNLNADCRDAKGNIWLGSSTGVMKYTSTQESFHYDPTPSITAVTVFMKAIDFSKIHAFQYDQNYMVLHFAGLWFTNPDQVRFRYKMEGYDLDWKVTKDHLASYSNLPDGHYLFRVQTSEHGSFDHTPEASYAFSISKAFWRTWWFIGLSCFTLAGVFYFWINGRENRFQREALLRKEKADSQFAALKSQINPHFLFNSFNTLITIIEEQPKTAVEYVEHLSDFYRSMMSYREKDFISLQDEMAIVHDFYYLLQKRFEDNFHLQSPTQIPNGFIMPLTLQMLVENAVKHNVISKAHPLQIDIFIENAQWMVVRNNLQSKIIADPSTHFGLRSLIERYSLVSSQKVIVEKPPPILLLRCP
ncbi:MAG: histidine kinase [Lewinellaceae bacterium]|nr:histidine kinase [Lewinellaceae bacterium]